MAKNAIINDMTVGNVKKQLIILAIPLFFSNLLQSIYGAVDMMVVGHYVGSAGLSAVSIGSDIMGIISFIAMGFASAGQVIISQYLGAGRRDKIKNIIGTMFSFLFLCALVIGLICFIFRKQIIGLLNTPEEATQYTLDYLIICVLGIFFIYGYNIVSAILRGLGNSRMPFVFIAVAAVSNLILDLIFVAAFKMNVAGAALATVLGQGISFIWSIIYLYRRREEFGFDFKPKSFKMDMEVLPSIVKLGIPMSLQSASIHFSKLVVDSWINAYGVIYSAVTGIGSKLGMLTGVFAHSLSTAGSTMAAQNIGAEKYDRVVSVLKLALSISVIVATISSALTIFAPDLLFGIFTSEAEVLEACHMYIPIACIQFYASSLNSPFNAVVNGSGNSKLNLAIALLDGIVGRIGIAVLLGFVFKMGIMGFWYGHALAIFMPFVVGIIYFASGKWKTRKYIIHDN